MKIVLTHPFCWPYVRRGAERFISELARYLTGKGHEVVTVSTKPGRGQEELTDGGRRILHRQIWTPAMASLRVQPAHMFFFSSLRSLVDLPADVVHSLYFVDSSASILTRTWKKHRTVFQITGPPIPYFFPRLPPDRWLLRQAVLRANRVVVHSEFARQIVKEHYGREPEVIPVPVDVAAFPLGCGSEGGPPTILSVASFDDPRKGLRVLVEAFEYVKRDYPDARLRLSGELSPEVRDRVLNGLPATVRAGVEHLGVGRLEDVSRLYREASITVLPSMWEAYGMVVLESWASGTPVVVTDHGGLSELVRGSGLGVVFDPETKNMETRNARGLAEAIVQGLELSRKSESRVNCRKAAERFSWGVLGPAYERLYGNGSNG
jgi:phosphatidylinositol alpha-mannosyltransferase